MALTAGTKLGPYEIQSPLGAGGMGEVYRARDTRLGRDVAIKVLPSHLSSDPDLKARFEREAKAISALGHPHICHLYDIGSQDGTDYLVMELLEGETLADRLKRGPLPLKQALQYGAEIAQALEIAHSNGIVHRDLKPGNIMLTKSGAKLLDFGLAKPAPNVATVASGSMATMSKPLTVEGTILGTFQYMAPEQVQGRDADARSDLFALGAVLYEMTTGKRAFAGKSQISVMSAILEKDPEPVSAVQPLASPALDSRDSTRPGQRSQRPLANGSRSHAGTEVEHRKGHAPEWSSSHGSTSKTDPRSFSVASLGRSRPDSDRRGNLVAEFEAVARNHVFSGANTVSGKGHRRGSERAHHRSGRLSGIRAQECSLDLSAGF
jgi:serine/threonine protein kinase